MPLLSRRTPDSYRPSPKSLLPGATCSSTAWNQRPVHSYWMLRPLKPPRPPPVSCRSQGLWPVDLGCFPLAPTWSSSPALQARDRRGLLQKIPYCQPAPVAASLHRGWRITRSPACPSAGADDPGWNLNSPPPPPFIIPAAVWHYTPPPLPRSLALRYVSGSLFVCHPDSTKSSRTSWLQGRGMVSPPPPPPPRQGWAGGESLAQHSKSLGSAVAHCSPVAQRTP